MYWVFLPLTKEMGISLLKEGSACRKKKKEKKLAN
jgi:predicted phosphoadenosine phosphosulfate sulfurtransferase